MTANPQVERGTFLVIRCDGSEELIREKPTLDRIHAAIGTDTLEFVTLTVTRGIGGTIPDLMMAVDDAGWETETVDRTTGKPVPYDEMIASMATEEGQRFELRPTRARKPVNPRATELYLALCRPGETHQIVGDVAILHDRD
jgi:hypothetical protein